MLLSVVLQMNSVCAGPEVTLMWNTDPNSGVLGHRVLCGSKSGDYSIEYEVGDTTVATVILPDDWPEYFLAVVAYNSLGITSEPSNEVIFRPRTAPTLQLTWASDNELVITWNSIPGTGYRVLQCPEFQGTNWNPVSPLIVADRTTTRWSATIEENVPAGFFRVEVVPISDAPPELRLATMSAGLLELSWNTVPGASYRVLHKPTLEVSEWVQLAEIHAEDVRFDWVCPIDPMQASGFYKIETVSETLQAVR